MGSSMGQTKEAAVLQLMQLPSFATLPPPAKQLDCQELLH